MYPPDWLFFISPYPRTGTTYTPYLIVLTVFQITFYMLNFLSFYNIKKVFLVSNSTF